MSINNPFEKLNIKYEDEKDEEGEFEQVKSKEKNVPFGIETRKKKMRPKEKVENTGEEGFEEVKKIHKRRPGNDEEDEEGEEGKEHRKRRGINYNTNEERDYRLRQKPSRGRRYDRQSGTGRGREIAKDGAGGKYTWNENPEQIARDYENSNDDYYFEEALNPEKKERRDRRRNNLAEGEKDKEENQEN